MLNPNAALVLFSGGQDSTTCLAWALERFDSVETIGFEYGQRHAIEISCRGPIRDQLRRLKPAWERRLGDDRVLDASILGSLSATSLTAAKAITTNAEGLPTTFVPGRNVFFLTLAAVVAYQRNIKHIVTGVCETDYSGYPDCRDDTIKAMQLALNSAMARQFVLHTPLMWVDKAHTWELAAQLGGESLIEVIRTETHTCYLGTRDTLHPWGYGCAACPACDLRSEGHAQWVARRRPDCELTSEALNVAMG
jgi:7-cyano-7-deazaguanine synthase